MVADSLPTDEALMLAAAKDDLAAFETLVKRHQNRVYRMAYQMLHSEEDAWDVSQEIFIKIHQARHSYVEEAKFTTWLYRIANNAVIDRIRKRKRHRVVSSMDDMHSELESDSRTAHGNLHLAEVKSQVAKALSDLTERQRGMVILRYYEGFSVAEIADVFECAPGTVKATLFQAVRHLRDGLGALGVINSEVAT